MQALLLDYDKTEWNMFRISDRLAFCAQQAVVAKAPPKPILVSLVDIAEDDVKVGYGVMRCKSRGELFDAKGLAVELDFVVHFGSEEL